jgi:hypothetical protein
MCQIEEIDKMDSKDNLEYTRERLQFLLKNPVYFTDTVIKRLKKYRGLKNNTQRKQETHRKKDAAKNKFITPSKFHEGDIVQIRSRDEIQRTLDKNNKLEGCAFLEDMWQYCGTKQKIIKKVNNFYDEANSRMCKARNTVLLEGVYCSGKGKNKPTCDRMCLYFWKEDWLEQMK